MWPQVIPFFAYPHALALSPAPRGASATDAGGPGGPSGTDDATSKGVSSPGKLQVKEKMSHKEAGMTSHSAPCIQWDMQGFLVQCLDVYRQLAGPTSAPFRKVVTPYLDQKPETPEQLAPKQEHLPPLQARSS